MSEKAGKTKWVIVVERAWVNPEAPEGIFAKLPHAALNWIFERTKDVYSIHGKKLWAFRSSGLTLEKDLSSIAIADGFETEDDARAAIKIVNGTKHVDLGYPMFARPVPVIGVGSI